MVPKSITKTLDRKSNQETDAKKVSKKSSQEGTPIFGFMSMRYIRGHWETFGLILGGLGLTFGALGGHFEGLGGEICKNLQKVVKITKYQRF